MNLLFEKAYESVVKENMITENDKILVGFSGGADSLFLMEFLADLRNVIKIEIFAAHLNHGIRGIEAEHDADFARCYCKQKNIPFFYRHVNIPEISKADGISEETAGRNERYRFFNEICKEHSIEKIAVAHNKNDSVETMIYNLIRGSSLKGLCGIRPVNGNIIRPIISISRKEIESYLLSAGLSYCTDSTNSEDIYTRNKIRNRIIPLMAEINESVTDTVYSNSESLRCDDDFIDSYARSVNCISENDNNIIINRVIFQKEHPSVRKRILMEAFERLTGSRNNISGHHLDILLKADLSGKCYDMPCGVRVCVSFDEIIFEKSKEKAFGFNIELVLEKEVILPDRSLIVVTECNSFDFSDKTSVFIDADKVKSGHLIARNRRDGDKMIPFGMKSHKKLKEIMLDLKIPFINRDLVPVVTDGDEIVSLVPYRISEKYKITTDTKRIYRIKHTKEK